jgi:hypothetical protein
MYTTSKSTEITTRQVKMILTILKPLARCCRKMRIASSIGTVASSADGKVTGGHVIVGIVILGIVILGKWYVSFEEEPFDGVVGGNV